MERVKRLAKLVSEAIKKPNATTRHLRQYPVSDKDVAKPVKPEKKKEQKQSVAEAGPFSYGFVKQPRKGSVAYNAMMKRKEQDKNRVKEIEAIGTKNHHVGVAKVTKGVAEGTGKNVVKSVKVGNFRHDLVDTGMGWQVRIYNGDELHDTGMSKNSEQKGLSALEDAVAYTEKQTRTKRQGVAEGYTGRETKDGTWRVFKDGQAVAVAGPFKARAYHKGNLGEETNQLDEISLGNYKEKAEKEVGELKPHAKGEYGDFAKKIIAKRKAGLQRAMKREDVNNEAYMGKVKLVSNPREKWMKSVKDRGYDMRAGAQRLQDLLDKQKKERAEMEQRAKEKGLEY